MSLYNLTLHPTATSVYAVTGNFLSTDGDQEIVVAQGGDLSLLIPLSSARLNTLHSYVVHHPICSLARLTGSHKDRVLIGFNSAVVLVAGYTDPEDPKIQMYYKASFCNPMDTSIQFITSDPYGKAFVFSDSRESKTLLCMISVADKFTLIEYRLSAVPCSVVALDGWDSIPIVAVVVPDSSGAPTKHICYYSVDLRESHFFDIGSTSVVDNDVNHVVAVPRSENGPGGAILFARNKIIYKKVFSVDEVTAHIPLIRGFSWEQGYHVISATTYYRKNSFFLQTESGDVFEATLVCEENSVKEIKIKYIDTIPATSVMCFLEESYFLFMGSKTGNHALYLIKLEERTIGNGPRGLKNLVRKDYSKGFTHLKAMQKNFFEEEAIQTAATKAIQTVAIYGVAPDFSMKTLRLGLATKFSTFVITPCGTPDDVWTVKINASDMFDTYVVMSFENSDSTHVFLMNGELAPENAGVIGTTSSLVVGSFGNDSILQVHRRGVRHINKNEGRIREYQMSEDIVEVAYNRLQVVVAFGGGVLDYYCLHRTNWLHVEGKHNIHSEVDCLSIPIDPPGEMMATVLAIGLYDNTIRILCLSPLDRLWEVLTVLEVASQPESLLFLYHRSVNRQHYSLFLNIGLRNGILIRKLVSKHGQLASLPSKYLGSRPIKLYAITIDGEPAILCLSSRIWIGHNHNGRFLLTPLYCEALETAASYSSDDWEEGIIGIFGDKVGIFSIEYMGDTFNEEIVILSSTERQFMLQHEHEDISDITTIGSDHGAHLPISFTIVRDKKLGESSKLELEDNEAAVSACNLDFHRNVGDGPLLVVGTDFRDSSTAGSIRIYRWREGKLLELMPSMQLEGVPQALCRFGERLLLAGIGPVLRMYELGGAKLHKRCEIELFPKSSTIVTIQVHQNTIFFGDSQEEVHRFEYRTAGDKLFAFKYANVPRRLAASCPTDSNILAGADKLGNVFLVRFPHEVNEVEEGPKVVDEIGCFHVGGVVTCLLKASNREGADCLIYGTDTGNLGALLELSSEDMDFFLQLEMCMRREYLPFCHWDRRTDQPACPHAIDGDLCEQFETLSHYSQKKISDELGCTELYILKKLRKIKNEIV